MNEDLLINCTLCPRECRINRLAGYRGRCGMTSEVVVARAALHMWEEPCISGEAGSGTVFFSGCALGCVYCQNHNIASGAAGKSITVERLAEIFIELQQKGANNINLVTPGHFIPQIKEALINSKKLGLKIPIVYNSSGYERPESLQFLEGLIDIYLPDFKYLSSDLGLKYSKAKDYSDYVKKSIAEMFRQVGKPEFSQNGIMEKGMIVRQLILPGQAEDSKQILKYLYETYKDDIYISIMSQYTPLENVGKYPEINRKLTEAEYDDVVDYGIDLGIENGFIQEGDTATESFIPEFNGEGV
jgi:putative pyruvate formate lyase activating enzyme